MDCNKKWEPFMGQVVEGKYHLRQLIGCGSFGGVFLADEVVANSHIGQVAVKLIAPSPGEFDKQFQELRAMRNLNHPHLARGLAVGQCRVRHVEFLYVVMDVAEGTLRDRLKQGTLSVAEAQEMALHVCEGLAYLHSQDKVHRDIKPSNILRIAGRWQIADFGTVREMEGQSAGFTAGQIGTWPYMPPEAFRGGVGPAGDAWALGVLLVESLTGKRPFPGATLE